MIRINDVLTQSQGIHQMNGILQGDPISPIMVNVFTHNVIQRIQTEEARMWLYADDTILLSERRGHPARIGRVDLGKWPCHK
jgi:Reverse transcriptase (RNA-dependent DNA polymerase).